MQEDAVQEIKEEEKPEAVEQMTEVFKL